MSGSKQSWWQVTKTPAYGFALGALWAVLAGVDWIAVLTGGARHRLGGVPAQAIVAPLATLLALIYLASSIRLRRRLQGDGNERRP